MISYVALERIRELELKLDDTADEMNKLVKKAETLAVERDVALADFNRLRAVLEEILDECKDQYDVEDDPTGYGAPHPNRWMRLGTMIEEALSGKGVVR